MTTKVQEGGLQSPHTVTQSEWQQGEEEGAGQLDHSTGSLSEQPPLWWSVRGQLLCGHLQCVGQRKSEYELYALGCSHAVKQLTFHPKECPHTWL